jgi:hypothetical protein
MWGMVKLLLEMRTCVRNGRAGAAKRRDWLLIVRVAYAGINRIRF